MINNINHNLKMLSKYNHKKKTESNNNALSISWHSNSFEHTKIALQKW